MVQQYVYSLEDECKKAKPNNEYSPLDTTMHTFSNTTRIETIGDVAIAPMRESIVRTSFVMTYGDYRNIENFREEAMR